MRPVTGPPALCSTIPRSSIRQSVRLLTGRFPVRVWARELTSTTFASPGIVFDHEITWKSLLPPGSCSLVVHRRADEHDRGDQEQTRDKAAAPARLAVSRDPVVIGLDVGIRPHQGIGVPA